VFHFIEKRVSYSLLRGNGYHSSKYSKRFAKEWNCVGQEFLAMFFKDTSWTDVSVSRGRAKRPDYSAVDTDVDGATPRCTRAAIERTQLLTNPPPIYGC
jgi:hypothetical protein